MLRTRWSLKTAICLTAYFAVSSFTPAHSGVMLQGFYANVPSGYTYPWWWDHLASQANALRISGFTAIWLPPELKGASGGYSSGYDPFDDYDLGSKNQMGTIPTHFGSRERLERCCGFFRSNGIDIYADIVDNHRNGDDGAYNFHYVDAYGTANSGRFQKGQYDFHPNVPQDSNVPDGNNEVSFGRDLAPMNGAGGWVYNGLEAAGDWQTKALDLQGYRLDYVKGISTDWLKAFLNFGSMNGKFAVGEFFDGNLSKVQNWVSNSMGGRANAFDFPLRDQLKAMCNGNGSYHMALLDHAGLAGVDPGHAVTFVENHDTDGSDPVTQNKALGYAYILTSEGYPCVFYKDYSTDAGCYGMKTTIDNLIWIHEKIATGSTVQRWKDGDVFAYERTGGSRLLVGLNDSSTTARTITVATGFGANWLLHDYTGHAGDVWTDGSGNVTITIPKDTNGLGYVCYSVGGIGGGFTANNLATTQEYAGAQDLDIKPADNTAQVQACRVYLQSGKTLTCALYYTTTSWTSSTRINVGMYDPSSVLKASMNYYLATAQGATFFITAASTGYYTFKLQSYNTPAGNLKPNYWLRATYTTPQTATEASLAP